MVTAVRLTVLTGPHKNRKFCFCGPTRCQMGRALDCFVQLSGAERDQLISRHHCQLDIDPPSLQVRDLGSRNGTFINGKEVESSLKELSEKAGAVVNHGDVLTMGGTTVRVDILDCPHAGKESEGKSIWEAGETAKKDCRLPC
jgi:predicted component of type VI protein secretion system